jgi:hypothetical protein
MVPLMQLFDTFVATDKMPSDQREELLSIPRVRFEVVEVGEDADWFAVARHMAELLNARNYSSFLSVLDDFYFFKIDETGLLSLIQNSDSKQIGGIRLVKEKPRVQLLFTRRCGTASGMPNVKTIPSDNPYKHSLSLSFWNLEYFRSLLNHDVSIWDFERLPMDAHRPVLHTVRNLCAYNHIVEKGQVAKFAKKLPGSPPSWNSGRSVDTSFEYAMRWFRANLLFFFLGYTMANRRFRGEEVIDSQGSADRD